MNNLDRLLVILIWICFGLICLLPANVDATYFFPYIVPKTIAFRVTVEFLVLFWLIWKVRQTDNQLNYSQVGVMFLVYLVIMAAACLLGGNFYFSFWSNMERSEGLVLWLHLLALLIVLTDFLRDKNKWPLLLNLFFFGAQVVALVGLMQFLHIPVINASSGGDRIAATIGNAAFLAGYLLFAVFTGWYLAVIGKVRWLKWSYSVFILLDLFIIIQTGTRGAYLALLTSLLLAVIFSLWKFKSKKITVVAALATAVIILLLSIAYFNRDSDWVQASYVLKRITSISVSEHTAQTRLTVWQEGWKAFLDRPILGYGQERFYVASSRYYNPVLYEDSGSRIWFDRAHNILIDHLITGGLLGLLAYLIMILWPVSKSVLLYFQFSKTSQKSGESVLPAQLILPLSLIAFVIQGIFVFESLPVLIALVITVAAVSSDLKPKYFKMPRFAGAAVLILYLIIFVPLVYYTNVREAIWNRATVRALELQTVNPGAALDLIAEVVEQDTSGTNEYRRRFTEMVATFLVNKTLSNDELWPYVERVDKELEEYVISQPENAAHYLLTSRHYNHTYIFDVNRLQKAIDFAERGLEISPGQFQFYYEIGYARFYLGLTKAERGEMEEAAKEYDLMKVNFDKAIELNPTVLESYVNIIMVLLASGRGDQIQYYLETMESLQIDYLIVEPLNRLAGAAVSGKEYEWAAYFYEQLVGINSGNPSIFINLALAYAYLDENEKAIALATEIKKFGEPYAAQADQFINQIKSGTFVKEP